MTDRRFPPPWTVVPMPGGFKVVDTEQLLAYCYARQTRADADTARCSRWMRRWGQATFLLSELPGSCRAPSEPFGTSNRTFKGVMRSNGG